MVRCVCGCSTLLSTTPPGCFMFCNPKSNQIQNYFITTFIWNQAQGSNGNTWRLDWCRGGVKTGVVDNTNYGSRRDGAGLMLVFCKK